MGVPSLIESIRDLGALLDDVCRQAEDTGYGVFPGGDPRTFTPDPKCCTDDEHKAWKEDCARAEKGEAPTTVTHCDLSKPVGQMMRAGYGLGTYTMTNPEMQDVAERLERVIHHLEAVAREMQEAGTLDPGFIV